MWTVGDADARKPDDPRLAELVGDLSIRDDQFRRGGPEPTSPSSAAARRYNHPVVGEITLEWDALTSDAEPDQQLIVYTLEPRSRSEEALRELAAWAAEYIRTPR